MTDREIADEYLRIEAAQNKLPRGADPDGIINILAAKYAGDGITIATIRRAVIDHAFTRPM